MVLYGLGTSGHSCAMSEQEFRAWLQKVDVNGDGRISRQELKDALRVIGMNCAWWKAWRAKKYADLNHNNYIDGEQEIKELIQHAAERWGIVVRQ